MNGGKMKNRGAAILLLLAVFGTAAAGTVRTANAAYPTLACARSGQTMPIGANLYNTVLVKLWHFDRNMQPITKGRFRLVRIGSNGKHIPITKALPRPGCWVLFSRLPNFSREPMTLCVVLRGGMRGMPDPAHPNRPAACPVPSYDGESGLDTYRYYVQDV
jgi:hypothetical protein